MSGFVHSFTWTLAGSRKDVFVALSHPHALRQWFAEHMEIDARPGGAFRFWGKYTLDVPTKDKATQEITNFEDGRQLAFSWPLFNTTSEVQLLLDDTENKNETRICGRHRLHHLLSIDRAKEMIDDLWRLHGGNLSAYMAGGAGITRPDFHDASPEIQQSIVIDAARPDVFKALVTPRLLVKWMWGDSPVVEARKGGTYAYDGQPDPDGQKSSGGPTKILDYVENQLLVTDWRDWRGDSSIPAQRVTWRLEDAGKGKTRVTVCHAGFKRAVDVSDYPFGWATFLSRLRTVVEN